MNLTRGLYLFFLILTFWWLAGCSVVKKIFTKKESTQIEETHESTTSSRTQLDHSWNRIGSSLTHRDGSVAIAFDSLTDIIIHPDGTIQASGYDPVIHTTTAETRSDSAVIQSNLDLTHQEDSTGKSDLKAKENLTETETYVEKSTDPLPWIFGIGLILFFVWIVRKVTRFVP